MLKFKIDQKLKSLPHDQYAEMQNLLLSKLDVPYSTFNQWKKIELSSSRSIPAEKLKIIAEHLGCTMEELINDDKQVGTPSRGKVIKSQKIKTR